MKPVSKPNIWQLKSNSRIFHVQNNGKKRQNERKPFFRILLAAVFAVVLIVSIVLTSTSPTEVYAAETYTVKSFTPLNPAFTVSVNGTNQNFTNFSQMTTSGKTSALYCIIVQTQTRRYLCKNVDGAGQLQAYLMHNGRFYTNLMKNVVWKMECVGSGIYTFRHVATGKVMDVDGATYNDGRIVQLYDGNGSDAQKWTVTSVSGSPYGSVYIKPKANSTYFLNLDTGGAHKVQLWNAQNASSEWMIIPILQNRDSNALGYQASGFVSSFVQTSTGKNLFATSESGTFGNGCFKNPAAASNTKQLFEFNCHTNDGKYLLWAIKNVYYGTYIEIPGATWNYSAESPTKLRLYEGNDTVAQHFYIGYSMLSNGGYRLIAIVGDANGWGDGSGTFTYANAIGAMVAVDLDLASGYLQIWEPQVTENQTFYFQSSYKYAVKDVLEGTTTNIYGSSTKTYTTNSYFNVKVSASIRTDTYDGYTYTEKFTATNLYRNKNGNGPTLYRYFTANSYTVKYAGNSPTSGSTKTVTRTFNTDATIASNHFAKSYSLTLAENGGTDVSDISYTYTFKEWNTKADGSGTSYAPGADIKTVASNLTLYAIWTPPTIPKLPTPTRGFEVILEENGGADVANPSTLYTFNGWNTANDGSGTNYNGGASASTVAYTSGKCTLYAQWTPPSATGTTLPTPTKGFTVILDENGGTPLPDIDCSYKFGGWATNSDGTGNVYTAGTDITTLPVSGTSMTLYAKWAEPTSSDSILPQGEKSFTVTLNENGGAELPDITCNYTFDGWATNSDGTGDIYAAGTDVLSLGISSPTTTLYAKYTSAEGEGLPTPTRNGFSFYGWSENDAPTALPHIVASTDELSGSTTLWAYYLGFDTSKVSGADISTHNPLSATCGFYGNEKIEVEGITTSFKWTKIKGNITETVSTEQTYTPTANDIGCAIICEISYSSNGNETKHTAVSALYPNNILVDGTTAFINNGAVETVADKSQYIKDYPPLQTVDQTLQAGESYTFTYSPDKVISQAIVDLNGSYSYELYGLWGNYSVLLTKGDQSNKAAVIQSIEGVSKQGEVFDSLKIVVTAKENITLNGKKVVVRYLPPIYKVTDNSSLENKYTYYKGISGFASEPRTTDGTYQYFYEGDGIMMCIPVPENKKVTAGSYITIGNQKIYPTASTSTEGYIKVMYKNPFDVILGRGDMSFISIADSDLEIDFSNLVLVDDDNPRALNFSPLGVKLKDNGTSKSIRFGTVWYFDDFATENSWSRKDAMGTLVIRFRKILQYTEQNDFYNYLSEKAKEDSTVETIMILVGAGWDEPMANDQIFDENGVVYPEIEMLSGYLVDFINEWTANGNTTLPSFGVSSSGSKVAANAPASFYYYVDNEAGNKVMEYSAVLSVPDTMYNEPLIYIPYVSYVQGSNGAWSGSDEPNVYLLKYNNRLYTANGLLEMN